MKTCRVCHQEVSNTICKSCKAARDRARYETRRKAGLCGICGQATLGNLSICERHWKANLARRKGVRDVPSTMVCTYTGETLIPGVNATLSDVGWISKTVARARGKLSHRDFLDLCWKIVESDK